MAQKAANKLRVFKDEDDMLDNCDNDVILKWVNAYARAVDYRKGHQKVYQAKRRLLVKYASQLLDKDEIARIGELAEEAAATQLAAGEVPNGE